MLVQSGYYHSPPTHPCLQSIIYTQKLERRRAEAIRGTVCLFERGGVGEGGERRGDTTDRGRLVCATQLVTWVDKAVWVSGDHRAVVKRAGKGNMGLYVQRNH